MRIIAFCAALALLTAQLAGAAADDDIVFAPKNFADQGDEFVGISGALTGTDIAYKNNTYAIACFKGRKECLVTYIEQIGPNQIGRIEYPYSYPVVSWTAAQVVASEEASTYGCSRVTITITRKTETALWVEEPVNQSTPQCAKSDGRVRKYTVEQSIGWKRLNGK
jgi:hypothetical protein